MSLREASSRSLIAALTWLALGLGLGLVLALRNGGWFVLLQRVARRRLARAGNLPPHPYDFLEWGIEKQIFRRVGGGVRFRHYLIQQQLAKSHQQQLSEAEARSEMRGPVLAFAGVFLALAVLDLGALGLGWAFGDLLRLALIALVVMRNCKTLDLGFRALLTEDGAERLELARA
jgi:hypothetical protein